jgi:antitoxin VapB
MMQTARIFTNGNSQAVRLPKEFRFDDDEVIIKKVGNAVILLPKRYAYADLKALLDEIGSLELERSQPKEDQERDFG